MAAITIDRQLRISCASHTACRCGKLCYPVPGVLPGEDVTPADCRAGSRVASLHALFNS